MITIIIDININKANIIIVIIVIIIIIIIIIMACVSRSTVHGRREAHPCPCPKNNFVSKPMFHIRFWLYELYIIIEWLIKHNVYYNIVWITLGWHFRNRE